MAGFVNQPAYGDTGGTSPRDVLSDDSVVSCASLPELSRHRTCAVQTEGKNYKKATLLLRNKHSNEVRKINRSIRAIRRKYAERFRKLKNAIKGKDKDLMELQLKIPVLQHQRTTLRAEREAIDKQVQEENERYQVLQKKFEKLHAQLLQFGNNGTFNGLVDYGPAYAENGNNNAYSALREFASAFVGNNNNNAEFTDSCALDFGPVATGTTCEASGDSEDFWIDDNFADVTNGIYEGHVSYDGRLS